MTDNDIIKALMCHRTNRTSTCEKCPLFLTDECSAELSGYALDLINRQKAEIERLNAIIENINDSIDPLPFETDFDKAMKKAKTEAIKEFAERLKIDFGHGVLGMSSVGAIIDNLVKVMTEE